MDEFMDEYTTSWSDAVRTEADFLRMHPSPSGDDNQCRYGVLGAALWNQRYLAALRAANAASFEQEGALALTSSRCPAHPSTALPGRA
jgi:hypothetical protein